MRVIHITRRRMALLSLALGMVIGSALLLAGCFGGEKKTEIITAATPEERVAYLEGLGWQVEPQPLKRWISNCRKRWKTSGQTTPSCKRARICPLRSSPGSP